jgi:hypothetical protein
MTADLLQRVSEFVDRFVVLPSEFATTTVALFVLHTWALDAAHATPYLTIVSPEKETGKSRLLEVLALLVRKPWHTASTTEAALFRKIERDSPCLLLDEIDAVFGSNRDRTEPLRAALNAGNRRGAVATRVVGQGAKMDVRDFAVFCPKVLAGIDTGRLPETIQSRSIMVRMKRRHDSESVERLRYRFADIETEPLKAALEKWAAGATEDLRDAVPELPNDLGDRAADGWEPLLAIADLAGGEWTTRARQAAVALSTRSDDDELGRGAQLLAAIREALGDRAAISTSDLLKAINADDELPFGAWNDGKGLDSRGLAKLLKPYGVKSRVLRIGAETPRGYRAEDLSDAWDRYLHPQQRNTDATKNPDEHSDVAQLQIHTPLETGASEGSLFPTPVRSATSATCVTVVPTPEGESARSESANGTDLTSTQSSSTRDAAPPATAATAEDEAELARVLAEFSEELAS